MTIRRLPAGRPRPSRSAWSRRRWLGVLGVAWLPAACDLRGPLRAGFIAGLSGRVADLGIGGRNGAQLAVEDLNRGGGSGRRPIELLVRDDEHNADLARQRFIELVDAGARFVVGPMTSAIAVAIAALAEQRSIALISPTATTPELTGRADAFFRLVPDTAVGASQQADLLRRRGAGRLVTVADLGNRAFAESWTDAAARQFEAAGGQVAARIAFQSGPGAHFVELARRVAAAGADAMLVAASAADSTVLVQQVRRLQPELRIVLSSWAGTEQLPQLGGPALDGVLISHYFDRSSTAPRYLDFVERFRQRFGEAPGYPAVNAYDALTLGAQAAASGSGSIVEILRHITGFDGLQRRISFDEFGDSRSPIFHSEIRGGRYAALAS